MPDENENVVPTDGESTESTTEETNDTLLGKEGAEGESDETLLGKSEEGKEGEKTESTEEIKYEFKVPEGMAVDSALVETISPVLRELKIKQEDAQKLVDAYAPYVQKKIESERQTAIAGFKQTVNGWKEETQKELGVDAQKAIATAAKAINKFGTPGLKKILNDTGVGNHKELVKFFANVGKSISEDSFVERTQTNEPVEASPDLLYPSMKK